MAEDNPIEGLDPNQSAFEPMLDMMNQDIPEDLSRTTTTTTLYISGDQTQIDQPRVSTTTTMAPVETLDIVSQFRQSNPEVRVGDVNKVIPNASYEERMQLLFDYPDQFSEDIKYNNKINSYVTQLKDQGYKDDQILSYLEQQKEGKKSELLKNFPDLFDVKSINRKDNVLKALESENISYSKLLKFGSESKLKSEYPEFANLIDQKKKNDKIQKEIKAQEKKIDANIEAEKQAIERQLETGKNFIGQDMSPIDQEAARKRLRELEGEQTLTDFDAGDPFQGDTSRADIGKISYKEKPVTDFEFKRIDEFNVEPIVNDYRFMDKDKKDQELLFLDELNKNIRATGGTSLSDEQIREVYVDGTKPFNESYKEYDDKLWNSVSGIVSTEPVVDLNDEFFERHNTTRDEFINKRKLILSSGLFNTQKLGETYYTEEEFQAMYDRASEKLINEYGSTIGTYEKITGTNLRENPEQFYDESRKSSSLYTSDIDEDIVIGDSEQTSKNLRKRFGFLPYGSKDESQNYLETEGFRFSYDGDNLVIQSTITPEGKSSPDLVNGIEINMNGSDVYAKIKNFMSKAIITDEIKSVMNEYERGEGRFKGKFNDPMRAAIDLSNYILSKPHVFGDANGFATDGYGQGFLFGLIPMGGGKSKSDFMMDMSIINTQINALKAKDPIGNKYLIDQLNKNLQYAQYINEEKAPELVGLKGGALAALSGVTETVSGITEGVLDLTIDIPFLPTSGALSDDEVNMLKDKGLEEYQIADIQNKRIKDEVEYGIDEWLKNTTAVTDKSLADAGLTYELMKTMIHSLSTGAIVGFNPSLVPVAFGLQTTARVENELKDSDLSNFEKRLISWPMATFEGILEQRGLQSVLGPGKSKLFRWVAARALKNLPKNASLHAIEGSMKYTLKGLSARTILGILEGGSYEALTEVGQEAVEFTEKNIVNMLLDKEVFKNMPDITTEKGANEFLNQLGKAALLGGLSGGGMSAIGGTTNLLVNGFKMKGLNKSFENQYNVITSEEGRAIALSQINLAYQSKQITKEEANERIKAMNDAYPLMMEIPAELSSGQKRQSYDLMLERKALEAEVKNKDKNLVVKQTERIAEINNQLQQISKTDAVQEQETKEEVLPDEQPEMGLQEVGQRDTKDQQEEISPENSSNYANLTEDQEGNVVFFHRGQKGYDTVKPSSGKTRATSREEAAAVGKVGGVAMYYTDQNDSERAVSGDAQYAVKVPKSKVYDANTDSKNIKEEAKKRHEQENPGKAFDANTELAYVTKIAGEQGYQMVVAQWDGKTRAQTTQELTPTDVQEVDGNTVTKSFNEKYESNKDKGFVPVIPATQEEGLTEVYKDIQSEKSRNKEYDDVYFLFDSRSREKYSQEQITKMINDSNLSQEIKDKYNNIMQAKPESRRSEKTRDNIAGVEIKYPNAEQTEQRKAERTKPEYVDNAAKQNEQEDVESLQKELEGEFGMLTGENPLGKPLTEEENKKLNEKAEEWLKKKGYKPRRITGKYGQAENSFFVPGLTKQDAIAFAKEFNQESVAHSEGMIYQDGKMNPRKKSDDNFKMEEYSPESDFVSVVNTKDGLKTFAVGYDFNKEEDSTTKPKPKKKEVPKKEAKGIRKQIENARKAIAKILPGVEIVVHENEDSYRKATDETDGKKQASRGEYNSKTNKIHINVSKANNRTVAHEVFHAILMNRLKTDKATQDITERMIKALSKNLEGMPEVKQALDAFAANYDENIQSEEKLSELVGILAGNYAQMNKPSQSLIKRFLDRLAKMFGLKSFTDGEVVDLLNTIAGKVAVGEEISDVDIKVIPKNKTAEIKEANKRFQADFTDLKSGVTYSFDKNTNEFKKIEQKYITRNKSISDFNNVFMILHQPDSAFSGKISKKLSDGSEILVEGKGGIFYPIKFHEKGYFWASTSKAAQAMAESMNKAINKDGKIYMALTTAPTNKVLSSTNAANGVMNLFISLSKNPKFKITGIESILIKSYNKAFGDKIDSSNNLDEIVKIIEEKLGAEKSSFDDRKTFSTSIIDSVVKSIQRKKSNQDAQNSLADFFGEGMMAEDLITKFKKGSKISKANLTEAVSQMLTEPMLRDGKSKTENGSIYAILEIDGEVEAVDAKSETDHESYPKAIKSKGDSKTTLHLLTDRVKWNNVTIDPDTGKTVNKSGKVKSKDPKKKGTLVERWTQIMSPSAGITTQGVKIDTSEVTTPAKRKQKDDGPSRERVDKIIDGIVQKLEDRRLKKLEKDRTRGPLTAKEKLDATISYLKGSKLYQESTDLEREQIVRQLTEDLGIKIKKAPSVRKVLGKKKRTKVVVDQLAEYKRQIKEWNKSARLAKKDLNTRRKELAKLVKSMVRQGIMTSKQAGILVERSNIVNLENEEILNRFLDYAEKVFKNAEYAEKLRQASSIRKKIKRNLKKDNQAEVIAMAKQFAEIDPQMVEVLDLYMDYAEQMNDALKSSRIKGGEVDMRQAANLAEIAEFYQGAIDNQNKILKKEMIAKYQDLNLDENMSINEIKEIVEAIESGDVKQGLEAEVMSFLSKRFGVMSAIAKDMIKRKINPFTGETIDLTDHQIDMVSRLIDADLSTMDVKDAIKFVEYIDNFITNEITSGLESAISIYEGVRSIRNLAKRLIKARMPKLGSLGLNLLSEDLGRIWNQYLTSMPVLFDRIFQGTNRGLKVMKEIGLQDIINGKAKKIRVHKNIMDQYKKEFIEGDKKFMEAENVYERGMIAFMSRNLVGTVAEQKAEFERRKRLVLESIEYLENSGNKQERKKAEVYREVYGKLDIASAKDINSIREKASKKNIDAVSWWTDQWADKYNDLADVSLSVHNTILGTDTNYTPDKYKTLSSRVDISKEDLARSVEETGAFMSGTHIDRNKSGVLMETTRPKTLPKNRYVSFDFDMDNSLSMDKALTDIYTSAAIQKFYGATRSSSFEEVFGDTSSMVLERVSDYIRDLKGKGEYMSNKEISKIFNTVAKFGVSKALGGMSQALKQTIPVMMNTITNAGRFDFANKSDLDWVNNSDMAIVNRGIESETAIESADASVEINLDNIRTIMRGVDKLQGLYLKAFLQGPDVYVAKSSFISYYKQHMQRNGLSTELVEGEYNQDALEYAQMMVDRQQNVSDPALAGTFLSKAGNVAIVRKVIAPFASFVINQKGRMMADLRVLNPTNTTPTNEDKKAAARSLAGLMVELTVFHTLSAVIREGFKGAAKGLFGDEDEDKEEKEWGSLESNKKFWDASSYAFSSVAKDVLSPFPFVGDGLVSEGLNMLLENLDVNLADEDDVQAAIDAENELRLLKRKDPMTDKEKKELREKVMEQGKISVYEDDAVLKTLGVLSIGKDAIKDLNDAYMLYKNGEYEQQGAFGKKKRYVLERDREGLGSIVLGKFFTVTGLAPKDVGDIARYGMKEIKKKSISEKQYEKYQEVKKDLKRNPTEAEEYLIVNSGRKAKDITDDINRINKYFEGLTLDQMKEFVEAEKYGLHRGQWAIRNIKEGKTAKELTKERNIPTESKSMFSTRKGE
jgi:hypothetical protein